MKQSLLEILDILLKLDSELIDMVTEEDLDKEVEQADIMKKKIWTTLMDIDATLKCDKWPKSVAIATHPYAPPAMDPIVVILVAITTDYAMSDAYRPHEPKTLPTLESHLATLSLC